MKDDEVSVEAVDDPYFVNVFVIVHVVVPAAATVAFVQSAE